MNTQDYVRVSEEIRALERSAMQTIETLSKGPEPSTVILKSAIAAKVSRILIGLPIDMSRKKAINIVLDERRPPHVEFIEVETDNRGAIWIGERIKYGNFTRLRIMVEDILNS